MTHACMESTIAPELTKTNLLFWVGIQRGWVDLIGGSNGSPFIRVKQE